MAQGNVLGGDTYFRAPFYIYCLGFLYAIVGPSLWTARLFGLLIGLASIGMTYLIARRVGSRTMALGAATLQAVFPVVIYFEYELLLDPLFMLLMQFAVHRFLVWIDRRSDRDLFVTGLLFGLAAITRPTILVGVPVVLIWLAVQRGVTTSYVRRTTKSWGLFAAGLIICILPITVRNYVVADDPVMIASQAGINLYLGNNDAADGLSASMPQPLGHNWQIKQVSHIAETELGRSLKPGEVSNYWRDQAFDWMISEPVSFFGLSLKKLIYQFGNREISNNRPLGSFFDAIPVLKYNLLSFGIILPFALMGGLGWWRRSESARFIIVLVAVYILAMTLFFFSSRFRLPLLPFYFVMASLGVSYVARLIKKPGALAVGTVTIIVALTWFSYRPPVSYPDRISVQGLMSRGSYLYDHDEFSAALVQFRQAAQLDPAFPDVNLNLGVSYFRLGQGDSTQACIEREIELHPGRPAAYHNLASFHLVNGRYLEASRLLDQALAIAPYDLMANIQWLRVLANDSTVATDSLYRAALSAADATGNELSVLNWGASLLSGRGCSPEVTLILERAESAVPPPVETDDQAFRSSSRHERSRFAREKAKTYYLRGYCLAQSGQIEEAVAYTRQAIEHDSLLTEAYINLYTGYSSLGQLVLADSVRAETVARFPNLELPWHEGQR